MTITSSAKNNTVYMSYNHIFNIRSMWYVDSQVVINVTYTETLHPYTKSMEILYHFLSVHHLRHFRPNTNFKCLSKKTGFLTFAKSEHLLAWHWRAHTQTQTRVCISTCFYLFCSSWPWHRQELRQQQPWPFPPPPVARGWWDGCQGFGSEHFAPAGPD